LEGAVLWLFAFQSNAIVWSGTASGTLGGTDLNFTGQNLAQGLASNTTLYFKDLDGFGIPVVTTNLTAASGGVSAGTLLFNTRVPYTLTSNDSNGVNSTTAVTLQGANSLTITGTHSYTGNTTVNSGTLIGTGTLSGSKV